MKQVIRFTAAWCGPCKMYAPTFERVASEVSGVNFETVDVDSTEDVVEAINKIDDIDIVNELILCF